MIAQANAFLVWLADRGRTTEQCQQTDLDAWHTEKLATRRPARTFFRWCMKTGRIPSLTLPPQAIRPDQAPMHQHRRLAILRRVLNDDSLPLRSRFVAALVLLHAQPVSRIVRLTIDDITDDGTTIAVRLGEPPSPLPEPVAELMQAYIRSRQQPKCPMALPRPSAQAADESGQPPGPPTRDQRPPAARQDICDLPTRPPGPGPRHRESPRLPRQGSHPPGHRSRRNLEPIRPPAIMNGADDGQCRDDPTQNSCRRIRDPA